MIRKIVPNSLQPVPISNQLRYLCCPRTLSCLQFGMLGFGYNAEVSLEASSECISLNFASPVPPAPPPPPLSPFHFLLSSSGEMANIKHQDFILTCTLLHGNSILN